MFLGSSKGKIIVYNTVDEFPIYKQSRIGLQYGDIEKSLAQCHDTNGHFVFAGNLILPSTALEHTLSRTIAKIFH